MNMVQISDELSAKYDNIVDQIKSITSKEQITKEWLDNMLNLSKNSEFKTIGTDVLIDTNEINTDYDLNEFNHRVILSVIIYIIPSVMIIDMYLYIILKKYKGESKELFNNWFKTVRNPIAENKSTYVQLLNEYLIYNIDKYDIPTEEELKSLQPKV